MTFAAKCSLVRDVSGADRAGVENPPRRIRRVGHFMAWRPCWRQAMAVTLKQIDVHLSQLEKSADELKEGGIR